MAVAPTTGRTFLFTDIEGSTRLWETQPDAMRVALARHDTLMRAAVETAGGTVFKTIGDAFCAVFPSPLHGVDAATRAQIALHKVFADNPVVLRVRMALHHGDAEHRDNDYFGPTLNQVARVLAAGHGGQVLATDAVRDQAGVNRFRSLGRHRLKDIADPVNIHQLVVADLPDQFAPLRTIDSVPVPGKLPEPRAPLVGREALRQRLMDCVRPGTVSTLLGPGGTGKTRLALDTGIRIRDRFPHGAWWVDLEALREPGEVAVAIAAVLGIREEPGQSIAQTLADDLGEKSLLIILDNCEHLVDSVAQSVEGLRQASLGLAILATSREALGISGEQRIPVPPLALPVFQSGPDAVAVMASEAGRLFVDRARQFQPGFVVDDRNAQAVASICRRLDGIPLAIELAAARTRALAADQIDQRLDKRLRLLTGGSRTASPRQQTLRALIDWSHELLSSDEQTLFRRLAVFHGGWTLDCAENVCSEIETHWVDVVDGLTSLVDKSLVFVEASGPRLRYRMLETLREYASERLEESGEGAVLTAAHAGWFAGLVSVDNQVATESWLAAIDADHANVLAALRDSDPSTAATMALGLEEYWHRRGHWTEACEQLAAAATRCDHPPTQARLTGIDGWFRYLRGDSTTARQRSQSALEIASQCSDPEAESLALNTLAFLDWQDGDTDAARTGFEQSLALLRTLGDQKRQAGRLSNLGLLATVSQDWDRARQFLEEAMRIYDGVGDRQGIGSCRCNLADLDLSSGNPESALAHAEAGLACFEECHDLPGTVYSLANVAEAQLRLGRLEDADRAAADALSRCAESEIPLLAPILLELRVRARARLGDIESARHFLGLADAARAKVEAPRDTSLVQELDALLDNAGVPTREMD